MLAGHGGFFFFVPLPPKKFPTEKKMVHIKKSGLVFGSWAGRVTGGSSMFQTFQSFKNETCFNRRHHEPSPPIKASLTAPCPLFSFFGLSFHRII